MKLPTAERDLLRAARPFARASVLRATLQLVSCAVGIAAWVAVVWWFASPWVSLVLAPLLTGFLVRCFVLQHDAGHRSFLASPVANDVVGTLLSVLTGVPFLAWRTEHAWHHAHQGKLHERGIDTVNSPMTVEEALARPEHARIRAARIRPRNVLLFGAFAIVVTRKTAADFFMFRESFHHPFPNRQAVVWSVRATVVAHAMLHVGMALLLGPSVWLPAALVTYVLAGFAGASLFWVQHNHEHTWHAAEEEWSPVQVALRGSSHLALPFPLSWFSADIGLHHVHHLDSRIPNYRLREANRQIPALSRVQTLTPHDVRRSFETVFWSADKQRQVTLDEVL